MLIRATCAKCSGRPSTVSLLKPRKRVYILQRSALQLHWRTIHIQTVRWKRKKLTVYISSQLLEALIWVRGKDLLIIGADVMLDYNVSHRPVPNLLTMHLLLKFSVPMRIKWRYSNCNNTLETNISRFEIWEQLPGLPRGWLAASPWLLLPVSCGSSLAWLMLLQLLRVSLRGPRHPRLTSRVFPVWQVQCEAASITMRTRSIALISFFLASFIGRSITLLIFMISMLLGFHIHYLTLLTLPLLSYFLIIYVSPSRFLIRNTSLSLLRQLVIHFYIYRWRWCQNIINSITVAVYFNPLHFLSCADDTRLNSDEWKKQSFDLFSLIFKFICCLYF